jgi:Holliday junction DNA helicase RuvB
VTRRPDAKPRPQGPKPKHGDAIFEGTDYPKSWDGFVGQEAAVEQIRTSITSAILRSERLDHTLLASGAHGIGKTTMAQIIAYQMRGGLITVSGALSADDARTIFRSMADGDVLFWDEVHLAVQGNKNRADWILPMMTDGVLVSKTGSDKMPDITILAATTDVGKLPQTLISRFMVRPRLTYYTDAEATLICGKLAERMKVRLSNPAAMARIARAADNNPRAMRQILIAVRDLAHVGPVSLNKAFEWAGVTADGLTHEAIDILMVLFNSRAYTASRETIQATLGEPGTLAHSEQMLLQRGYIEIGGRGRTLTPEGIARAEEIA